VDFWIKVLLIAAAASFFLAAISVSVHAANRALNLVALGLLFWIVTVLIKVFS
jgi:hypothetical protein